MTKNNSKNKPKRTPAKRAIRAVASATANFLDGDHEAALHALTDPFTPSSLARYPDAGAGSTLTQRAMLSFTGATNASGAYAFTYDANFSYPITYAATIAGTTPTWNATRYGDWSSNLLNTYGKTARPITAGVRIVNTLSATDSSGYLVIAKGGRVELGGTTTYDPVNFTHYEVHPYTHGGEWHVTLRPLAGIAYEMLTKAGYDSNLAVSIPSWEVIYIGLFGSKASATPMLVEVVSNFEYTPAEDAPIAALASPQPILNIPLQTAVNQVQSDHTFAHIGGRESHKAALKKTVKKALVKHVLPFAARKLKQALI